MTINPLIPYIPAFLSFLIYGGIIGGLFSFGRRGGRGCLLTIVFWYLFAGLIVFFILLFSVESGINQICFALGVFLPYAPRIWQSDSVQAPITISFEVFYFLREICQKIYGMWQYWQTHHTNNQSTKEPPKEAEQHHQTNPSHDEAMRQEQARREAEARAKREQAERDKEAQQTKPSPETHETRTPESILGLKSPWTQEDLRTAYKREAGRTHPDKWIGKPEAIRQIMEAEYKIIQEAYRHLYTP